MAIMRPASSPEGWGGGKKAERVVFEALEQQLDDEFFVFYSLAYLDDKRYKQGEADFLVLHRTLGMLVIECKGAGVRRTGQGVWQREQPSGGWATTKNPFTQAMDTNEGIRQKLAPGMRQLFQMEPKDFPFAHGHAVIFPLGFSDRVSPVPLDQPDSIVYDSRDLAILGERVVQSMKFWKKQAGRAIPKPFSTEEFKKFRRRVLYPPYGVVSSLGGNIKADEQRMVRLSDEQMNAFRSAMGNPRIRVEGGAGTGKTLLAVEVAKQLADQGRSVLLLCYNAALADYLRNGLQRRGYGDAVHTYTFSAIARKAYAALRTSEFPVPKGKEELSRFWNEDVPLHLMEAIDQGKIQRYDAVVVDEGQDFKNLWWEIIDEQMAPEKLIIFYDPSQQIFGDAGTIPSGAQFELFCNFRNTVKIAEVVNQLGGTSMTSDSRCPTGDEPEFRDQGANAALKAGLNQIVKNLINKQHILPDQITILTPRTKPHSSLANIDKVADLPLATKPQEREGRILHSSIGAFKGLESDVLILVDIDPAAERCTRNTRYVAVSRAKHKLYVFHKGNWLE